LTRALAFLVRNWPLKLAAAALATLLYAGLVLSQNAQTWPGSVPIQAVKLPASAVLLSNLGDVRDIRFFAPADVARSLAPESFTASVDLSTAVVEPDQLFVNVRVDLKVADDRVQILDYRPQLIPVRLDPLVSKTVPVKLDKGTVPPGLELRPPELSATFATVSGPASVVANVTAARASVLIQPSGIAVDEVVPLVAVDALGTAQRPVNLEPSEIRVRIRVGTGLETKSLPVNPIVTGTPAAGFRLVGVAVEPAAVSVEGDADALADLVRVDTRPISILGSRSNVVSTVLLDLPDGVTALGATAVTVRLTLAPVTETRTFSAGLVLSGARDDRTYALSTDRVLVTLGGTIADLDRLDGRSFTVTVDVAALAPGVHEVPVGATLPAGIALVAASPATVTVSVGFPPTPPPSPSPSPSVSPSP
jgi:YbbR domain-containing protein